MTTATPHAPARPPSGPRTVPTGRGRGTAGVRGTGSLVRLALRRDRILLPVWSLGFALMATFSVAATKDLYPTEESLASASGIINATASLVALYGKVYAPTSLGAVSLIKMTAFGAALVAVLFVFLVVRHSRAEEESGRLELLSAGAIGRAAPLTAALVLGMGSAVVLGSATALGLILVGLPPAGSMAFGLSWALSGIAFSAVAGVTAQVTTSTRAAIGLGLVVVGVAYALRAAGDLAAGDPGFMSWLSPIGWSQQVRPFAGDRWWVAVVSLSVASLMVAAAFVLRARRDLGSGFLPERAGPAVGRIDGIPALSWRLQRGVVTAWICAVAVMGFVLGSLAHNVSGFFESSEMKQYLVLLGGEQGLTDAFLAAEVALIGAIVGAFAITTTHRLRSEESGGHAEILLADATTRLKWAGGHFAIALLGSAVVLLVTGAAIGLAYGFTVGDPVGQTLRLTAAAAAQIPAVWVMAGITLVVFGWMPLAGPVVWALYVGFIVLGEFGQLWELPTWVLDLSPFAHSPTLPGGEVSAGSLALLVAVAAALALLGFAGWRRRDLHP